MPLSRNLAVGSSCCLSFPSCAGPLRPTRTGSPRIYPRVQLSGGGASACCYPASNRSTGSHQASGISGGPSRSIADLKSMQCMSCSHAAADCKVSESRQDIEWQKLVQTANDAGDTALQRLEAQHRRDLEIECARKRGDFGSYPLSHQARHKASKLSVRPQIHRPSAKCCTCNCICLEV